MKFEDLIQSETPVLIDFYADWCGPCKVLGPIVQQVKNEMGDAIKVVKIDVDANQAVASKLQVMSIPTMMIYKKGKQLWRVSGVQSKQAIIAKLNESIDVTAE
ncbi:MAG TPA: thioredoxin [Saprospiraceae bacterium]|nr:thioredoxin [Saprospiraceae bacterium]